MISWPIFSDQTPFALYVNEDGAWLWHTKLAPQALFADHPDRAADLAHLLLREARCPVTVIADGAGQEVRLDTIPLLNGLDRRRLIVRRVQQHFPDAPFATCIESRRQEGQERLSILHLPQDGPVGQWTRWLAALPNPPGGIVASTRISTAILTLLAGNELTEWTHGFFLTEHGLRQVALHGGAPMFTRLTPLAEPDAAAVAKALQDGLREAQHYLARHGWRDDQSEQVIGVIPAPLLETARQELPPAILLLTPVEVGRWLHCPQQTGDWRLLFAAVAQKYKWSLKPLLLAEERSALRHGRIARGGWAAAACLLALASGMLGLQLRDYQLARQELAVAQAEDASIRIETERSRAMMGDVAAARARLRQAKILQQNIRAPAPWPLLLALEKSLPEAIRINDLVWEAQGKGTAVKAALTLKVTAQAARKDIMQQEALQLYSLFTDSLQKALPDAAVRGVRAPYALAAGQVFSDPMMLQTDAGLSGPVSSAQVEVLLP